MNHSFVRVVAKAAIVAACSIAFGGVVRAATITVNSLADDVFPDGAGAIFDINGAPIALVSPKCTLRMAMSAANLDIAVGGAPNGCAAGSGADTIGFSAALNLATTPGTITIASVAMSEAPAVFVPPNTTSALVASTPMTITGPGASQLTIDGSVAGLDGRRILAVSNGDQNADMLFTISGVRLWRGRSVDGGGGCMFSSKSVAITDVTFESCESAGGPTNIGIGGGLGAGNQIAGSAVPTVTITSSRFLGNRAVRGTNSGRAEAGGAFLGSGSRKVGAVTLTNVVFNGNSAEYRGGLSVQTATSVTISGSNFTSNAATGTNTPAITNNGRYGGFQVAGVTGNVDVINGTRVNGNTANEERAGFSIQSVGGTVTLNDVDVSGNYVNRGRIGGFEVLTDTFDAGGNCQALQLRPVNITDVRVLGNSVATNSGGFRIGCSGAVTITDSVVAGNETRGYRIAQTDVVSTGNSAFQIFPATDATAAQSTATLTRVTVEGNSTNATNPDPLIGGGYTVINIDGLGAFTADALRFVNNHVAQNEGLSLRAKGAGRNYLVTNSEFSGNDALGITALFMETNGNYTLRNSTVSGNVARPGGGNIVMANANTNTVGGINVAIEQSTIARNTAPHAEAFGVGVWGNPTFFGGANAVISVKNSIFGTRSPGFTGANAVFIDASVTNVSATNSLLEWTGGAPAGFCAGAGMKCDVGSLVNPLANNGGATDTRTMALLAGSPAINAGGAVLGGLTTDQRGTGFPRVIGGTVDMGAFEADPATTVGCTLDLDGNGAADALTDGVILLRALMTLTGPAATNGAIGGGATRPNWTAIRNYLNANCGSGFAP